MNGWRKLVFWLELVFWNWEPGQDIPMVMFPIPAPNHSNYVAVKARSAHSGQNPNVYLFSRSKDYKATFGRFDPPTTIKIVKMWNFPSPLTFKHPKTLLHSGIYTHIHIHIRLVSDPQTDMFHRVLFEARAHGPQRFRGGSDRRRETGRKPAAARAAGEELHRCSESEKYWRDDGWVRWYVSP